MDSLIKRIEQEGSHLGKGIIKVDGFINHQLTPALTMEMGSAFAERFEQAGTKGVTRILTAEVSGIPPALATGAAMGVSVVYARKKRPITMADPIFLAEAPSPTKGNVVQLMVSPEYLSPTDHILIIDDFLASGKTILALVDIINQCGASLAGIGCIIEKSFATGRDVLQPLNVPIITLAKIDLDNDTLRVSP